MLKQDDVQSAIHCGLGTKRRVATSFNRLWLQAGSELDCLGHCDPSGNLGVRQTERTNLEIGCPNSTGWHLVSYPYDSPHTTARISGKSVRQRSALR